ADVRPRVLRQPAPARPPARGRAQPARGAAGLAVPGALAFPWRGGVPLRPGVPGGHPARPVLQTLADPLLRLGARDLRVLQPLLLLRDRGPRAGGHADVAPS